MSLASLVRIREQLRGDRTSSLLRRAAITAGLVAAWLVGDHVLSRGLPLGEVVLGLVSGSLYALIAMGLVLVYRANRIVNFAQAELGAVAGVLAIELVIQYDLNYFLAIATGLVAAVLTGIIVDLVVIRAFRNAPRLLLSVATIGVAQILTGLSIQIPLWFTGASGVLRREFSTPFAAHFTVFPVRFSGDHVMVIIVVPVVIAGLVVFLRYTDYGVAIRASAENRDRAHLLGMPVGRLSTVVWAIAGLLSATAVLLRVAILGFSGFAGVSGGGPSLLLRTFAAAVIARMENMAVAALAAIGIGVFEALTIWTFGNSTYSDALLIGVILLALLLQRGAFQRAAETGISSWRAMREVRPIPTELRTLPEVRWGLVGLWAALSAFVVTFPLWATPGQEQLAALVFIYSIVAVSLVVLTGWIGQISLGQWALAGFGGAAVSVLVERHGIDLFVALLAGMVAAAAVAVVIGIPALRISGPFLAVTTLAFAVTAKTFFLDSRYVPWLVEPDVTRPALWSRLPISLDWQFYFFSFAFLVIVIIGARNLRNSRTGRAFIAVRDNEPAAQSTSLGLTRIKLTGFAISGAIAGLAGGLYVLHQHGLNTDSFGPEISLRLFTMVVIGGLGSLPGAILGAVYVRGVESFIGGGWAQLASGGGILLVLLVLPGGLGSGMYRLRDEILRYIAKRRGIVVPSLLADIRQEDVVEEQDMELGSVLESVRAQGADMNGARTSRPRTRTR
jgi:branched-chain amino acid transport system permease protein